MLVGTRYVPDAQQIQARVAEIGPSLLRRPALADRRTVSRSPGVRQ